MEKRQIDFELQSAPALLILDGATQHCCPEALDLLEKNNVKVHFLVPHSSHLTQPLDCLFFKVLKGELKKSQTIYSNLSKSSHRLVHGLSSLSKSIGWYIGLKSWHCAGFLVSLETTILTLFYDLSIILQKVNQIEVEVVVEPTKSKRKREKLFFSLPPRKKKKETPEEGNGEEFSTPSILIEEES